MEAEVAKATVQTVAEYGILALGWVLFVWLLAKWLGESAKRQREVLQALNDQTHAYETLAKILEGKIGK